MFSAHEWCGWRFLGSDDRRFVIPKTSSSESPSGRARARARPVALADRSVSPGEANHRDSPKLNGDLEEHFPVSLSNAPRGSLRSVLEDADLPELPCSPTGPPVRTSQTMPGARPRIRALSALSSDLSLKTDHLGERSLVTSSINFGHIRMRIQQSPSLIVTLVT